MGGRSIARSEDDTARASPTAPVAGKSVRASRMVPRRWPTTTEPPTRAATRALAGTVESRPTCASTKKPPDRSAKPDIQAKKDPLARAVQPGDAGKDMAGATPAQANPPTTAGSRANDVHATSPVKSGMHLPLEANDDQSGGRHGIRCRRGPGGGLL